MHAPVIMQTDQSKGLFLDLSETIYIENDSDAKKIFFHTKQHSFFLVRSGYDLELVLPGTTFEEIRGGSIFVNLEYVTGYDGNSAVSIPAAGDQQSESLKVAKRLITKFKHRYQEYNLGG